MRLGYLLHNLLLKLGVRSWAIGSVFPLAGLSPGWLILHIPVFYIHKPPLLFWRFQSTEVPKIYNMQATHSGCVSLRAMPMHYGCVHRVNCIIKKKKKSVNQYSIIIGWKLFSNFNHWSKFAPLFSFFFCFLVLIFLFLFFMVLWVFYFVLFFCFIFKNKQEREWKRDIWDQIN